MEEVGYQAAVGTYEEAKAMVGYRSAPKHGDAEVTAAMIRHFAAMVEDRNAAYWDEEFAGRQWGGLIAPPAMLMVWVMPVVWKPGGRLPEPMLVLQVPLPGNTIINVSNEAEFFQPVLVGDRLNAIEELVDVSDSKSTRLGEGHYVTTRATFRDQEGQVVAASTNVLFRFDASAPNVAPLEPDLKAPARPNQAEVSLDQIHSEDVLGDEQLPLVEDTITYRRTVMSSATTWDWFPGHFDPRYARAQGQPTIFVNTMHLLGFVDRVVTDWAGPATFVSKRRVELRRSVYAGDTITAAARVTRKRDPNLVDIDLAVTNQHGKLCVPASITVALPSRASKD